MRYLTFVIPCLFSIAMNAAIAEPIVVLSYGALDNGAVEGTASSHPFRMDPDYSEMHDLLEMKKLLFGLTGNLHLATYFCKRHDI